jgi:hypothetical protein
MVDPSGSLGSCGCASAVEDPVDLRRGRIGLTSIPTMLPVMPARRSLRSRTESRRAGAPGYRLLPGYRFTDGSPLQGSVAWFVLKTPVEISAEEISAFAKLYAHDVPPQPLNGRVVKESR